MPYDIDRDGNIKRKKRNKKSKDFIAYDSPTIDWQRLQAIITTVSVLFLVAAFLLATFFLYSDSPTVKSMEMYTREFARTSRSVNDFINMTQRGVSNVNMTQAVENIWPQTDEEMSNVTMRGKRVVSDLATLIGDVSESKVIKTIAELSSTISGILLRPNFGKILDSLEAGVPMIFSTLKKNDTKAFMHVLQATLNKVGTLLTEERVDKVINALDDADVKNLVSHASSFIQESSKAMKSVNKVMDKVTFVIDHEDEYVRPVIHTIEHIHKFITDRVDDEMIDDVLEKIKSVEWGRIIHDLEVLYVRIESLMTHNSGGVSLIEVGKNLTMEITALVKQIEDSGIIESSSDGIKKIDSALTSEEIHEGYVELISSMKKVNDVLHDLGKHHMLADFVSLVERFERMEKIVETIFTPLERGMDLYNEEQERRDSGKTGNIRYTNELINSIDNSRKDK